MRKAAKSFIAILCLSSIVATAFAASKGPYAGAGIGVSQVQTPNQSLFNVNTGGETDYQLGGVSGRAFVGYNFNSYLGVEAGIANYGHSKYNGYLNSWHSSLEYKMNALDLVGKVYLPVGKTGFQVYALGGAARVNHTVKYNNGGVPFVEGMTAPSDGSSTHHKIRPVFGGGINYDIPQSRFSTRLEISRVQGIGNVKTNPRAMPTANMVTFNISYNFD